MDKLIINGLDIELPSDTRIKYTRQISDIFDISVVSCSFTNSFSFPKTPQNTKAMGYLGISGDRSQVPYLKNQAVLKANGIDIVPRGWFNVTETSDVYTGNLVDGMAVFFKTIENKTLGNDLDLSNFEHNKTLAVVAASYSNPYYQYIVADYGGKIDFDSGINIDYLVPCFSVLKLWELIFNTFDFNCDYSKLSYINSLYITYPKDIAQNVTVTNIAILQKSSFSTYNIYVNYGTFRLFAANKTWDNVIMSEGSLVDNWKYVIPESTNYKFTFQINAYSIYKGLSKPDVFKNVNVSFLRNGVQIGSLMGNSFDLNTMMSVDFDAPCDAGDVIEVDIWGVSSIYEIQGNLLVKTHDVSQVINEDGMQFEINKTNLGATNLQNEFKDFLIKDFIKEILFRTGLTPIFDPFSNTISFISISDRIGFANGFTDLSDKYVKRNTETYSNEYAQKNVFKLKNNVDTDTTGDGYLYVLNQNIADEKIIVASKMFAPDKKISTSFLGLFSTNRFKIWNSEVKESDTDVSVEYKGMSGRFYFLRKNNISGSIKLTSEASGSDVTVSSIAYADSANTLFEEAVYQNYSEYQKIFNNFRNHKIELKLTLTEFLKIDLLKPVYFKQENSYYMCNNISYEEGKISVGEFVKINFI